MFLHLQSANWRAASRVIRPPLHRDRPPKTPPGDLFARTVLEIIWHHEQVRPSPFALCGMPWPVLIAPQAKITDAQSLAVAGAHPLPTVWSGPIIRPRIPFPARLISLTVL